MEGNTLTESDRLIAIANGGRPGAGARRRPGGNQPSPGPSRLAHGAVTPTVQTGWVACEPVKESRFQGGCMRSVSDLGVRRSGVVMGILLQALAGCSDPNGLGTGAIDVTVT